MADGADSAAPAAAAVALPPNQTLYLRNINEKIKKEGAFSVGPARLCGRCRVIIVAASSLGSRSAWRCWRHGHLADLKKTLYTMFSQHGPVVDVVAHKTLKMRGQAFVVFKDITSATNAMRALQGFVLFEKPVEVQYARGKSYAIAKEDGTYAEVKRKHEEEKSASFFALVRCDHIALMTRCAAKATKSSKGEPKAKRQRVDKPAQPSAGRASKDDGQLPNKILFCQNIPQSITEEVLADLFRRCARSPIRVNARAHTDCLTGSPRRTFADSTASKSFGPCHRAPTFALSSLRTRCRRRSPRITSTIIISRQRSR